MRYWRKDWYPFIGPLMIWAAFIILIPLLLIEVMIWLDILPAFAGSAARAFSLFCAVGLGPLAALADIAPPFVTRQEVNWRNRSTDELFVDVIWEDVPFLPPALNRVRSTVGRRKKQELMEQSARGEKPVIT